MSTRASENQDPKIPSCHLTFALCKLVSLQCLYHARPALGLHTSNGHYYIELPLPPPEILVG